LKKFKVNDSQSLPILFPKIKGINHVLVDYLFFFPSSLRGCFLGIFSNNIFT